LKQTGNGHDNLRRLSEAKARVHRVVMRCGFTGNRLYHHGSLIAISTLA